MTTDQIKQTKEATTKLSENAEFQKLISDLKTTVNKMRRIDKDDPKNNALKIQCAALVTKHPAWKYLENVVGVNYTMAAILLSQIDVFKVNYVTQVHSFCGVVTGNDRYESGKTATFNTYLKGKLMGELANDFISNDSEYALYYYGKIMCILNMDTWKLKSDPSYKRHSVIHIDRMAKRFMIQKFLRDLYETERTIFGLPILNGYAEEKLGKSKSNDVTDWKQFYNVGDVAFNSRRRKTRASIAVMKDSIQKRITEFYSGGEND